MTHLLIALSTLSLVTLAPVLGAQRFTVDVRGGFAMPNGKVAATELDPGPSLGATVAFRLQPHLHLYGGWDWVHFAAGGTTSGGGADFEETGYSFGLRFEHPIRASPVAFRLEAGGTYKHIEVEDEDGGQVANTGHGLGYEAAIGLSAPLAGAWRFVPAVRYRALSRDFRIGNVQSEADVRYVGLEIGISRAF